MFQGELVLSLAGLRFRLWFLSMAEEVTNKVRLGFLSMAGGVVNNFKLWFLSMAEEIVNKVKLRLLSFFGDVANNVFVIHRFEDYDLFSLFRRLL